MALKLHDWTEKYQGHIHSDLFIEMDDLDSAVDRSRKFGGNTTEIVVHQRRGLAVPKQTRSETFLIPSRQIKMALRNKFSDCGTGSENRAGFVNGTRTFGQFPRCFLQQKLPGHYPAFSVACQCNASMW